MNDDKRMPQLPRELAIATLREFGEMYESYQRGRKNYGERSTNPMNYFMERAAGRLLERLTDGWCTSEDVDAVLKRSPDRAVTEEAPRAGAGAPDKIDE